MRARRSRSRSAWLLAFALVAAQALGLTHRVVHGPQAPAATALHAEHAHPPGHAGHAHDHGGIAQLFSGHDDNSCRLYDAAGHDAAPGVPALAVPTLVAACQLQRLQGLFVARWAALFDARGPPALR